MTCKEYQQALEAFDRNPSDLQAGEFVDHSRDCKQCREAGAAEAMSRALLRAFVATNAEATAAYDNPYLMTRIKARIREMGEQGVSSWESAVLALRSWLLGFGVLAILLLTLSLQGRWQGPWSGGAQPAELENEATTIAAFNEDYISGGASQSRRGSSEESPYVEREVAGNVDK